MLSKNSSFTGWSTARQTLHFPMYWPYFNTLQKRFWLARSCRSSTLFQQKKKKKKCCSDPPTAPFRFKTLFPQLRGVLTVDSSGLMIPQQKTATWTRAKPPFWGKFSQPITGQCWSIKSWMDFLIDHPNSRGESTEVFVVTASLPECSFFPVLSFSFSYRYFFFFF